MNEATRIDKIIYITLGVISSFGAMTLIILQGGTIDNPMITGIIALVGIISVVVMAILPGIQNEKSNLF
jgi:hypothetical protein